MGKKVASVALRNFHNECKANCTQSTKCTSTLTFKWSDAKKACNEKLETCISDAKLTEFNKGKCFKACNAPDKLCKTDCKSAVKSEKTDCIAACKTTRCRRARRAEHRDRFC